MEDNKSEIDNNECEVRSIISLLQKNEQVAKSINRWVKVIGVLLLINTLVIVFGPVVGPRIISIFI